MTTTQPAGPPIVPNGVGKTPEPPKDVFNPQALAPDEHESQIVIGEIPASAATLVVFRRVVELVVIVLLIYFCLLAAGIPADRFATIAVAPIITILAGAAGYYFGRQK